MADTTKITTSLVVEFSSGGSNRMLKAEIDDRETGYNAGNTSFVPGDAPAFLLFKSRDVTVDRMLVTSGSLVALAPGVKEVTEVLTFTDSKEVSPSYPIQGAFTSKWLGLSGGQVSYTENNITIPSLAVALLKVTYTTNFTAYRMANIPTVLDGETTFSVMAFIHGYYA